MNELSLLRLYLLRATYLLLVVGLGFTIWPGVFNHSTTWGLNQSVVSALLAAVSLLAAIGIRYPVAMLPVLFFELVWKLIWLLAFALPLWRNGPLDAAFARSVSDCIPAIILPVVIPWQYVWNHYIRRPADRWK